MVVKYSLSSVVMFVFTKYMLRILCDTLTQNPIPDHLVSQTSHMFSNKPDMLSKQMTVNPV